MRGRLPPRSRRRGASRLVSRLALLLALAAMQLVLTAGSSPAPRDGSVAASVIASPLRIDVLAATRRTNVHGRVTVVTITRNLGSETLHDANAMLAFDEGGLQIVSHHEVHDGPIRGGGMRIDHWTLEPLSSGNYVISASLTAWASGVAIDTYAPAIVVAVAAHGHHD